MVFVDPIQRQTTLFQIKTRPDNEQRSLSTDHSLNNTWGEERGVLT